MDLKTEKQGLLE